ncbi:MAG: hypothetical protein OXC63_05485, partial [Aestuariivita sp.]|nr:hypothetical protein [Aestuariivita sp.]MCY4346622.1 hypothetical protein [Aestuariivita sp.]
LMLGSAPSSERRKASLNPQLAKSVWGIFVSWVQSKRFVILRIILTIYHIAFILEVRSGILVSSIRA